ncbi:uncharacterized protein LOC143826240 isoform X2 [Paroedura picta]|uniref:uncharacterized protein LOC143826240 isoform X2 n=1 Tax=Paroedura picta TaxID=143630 RepID=UPI0040571E60
MARYASLREQESSSPGEPQFKFSGASWMEDGQLWVLELQPDDGPLSESLGTRDLEENRQPQNAERDKLRYSSRQSKQNPEMGLEIQEHQHEPDGIKSRPSGHMQAKGTVIGNGKSFSHSLKQSTHHRTQNKKLLACDQCGKDFQYPSNLTRHQLMHSRQKTAKRKHSQAGEDSPRPWASTQLALREENTFIQPDKAFHQQSKATTGQNTRPRKWHFCGQCGKGCRKPLDLARHQRVHSRRQAAKWGQTRSEVDSPGPLEAVLWASREESTFTDSSQGFCRKSKATTGRTSRLRKRYFCSQCGKGFRRPSELARHWYVHSSQKPAKRRHSQTGEDSPRTWASTLLAVQAESTFTKPSKAFHQTSKTTTGQNTLPRKQHFCGQCGKGFRKPSDVTRHQRGHCRQQAARRGPAQSEVDCPCLLEGTPPASSKESVFAKCSGVLCQKPKTTAGRNVLPRKRHFCGQCGKGFRKSSELARHRCVPSSRKTAKQAPSEADNRRPVDLASLVTPMANISLDAREGLSQTSKVMMDSSIHQKRRCFCDQCGKAFWYPSSLLRHLRRHREQRAAKRGRSQSKAGLRGSASQAEGVFSNCRQTPAEESAATTEQNACWRRLICEKCGKAFRYPSDLARHQRVHSRQEGTLSSPEAESPTSSEPTPEEKQGESMFTTPSKGRHRNPEVTTDQRSPCSEAHLCDQCGEDFWSLSDFAQHMGVHCRQEQIPSPREAERPASSEPTPVEPQVERTLTNLSVALRENSEVATDESREPQLCDQCGTAFQCLSDLVQHMGGHYTQEQIPSPSEAEHPTSSGPTPVELQVERTLTNPSIVLHENSKATADQRPRCSEPYVCDQCGKAFRYLSDLVRHQGLYCRQKQLPSPPEGESPSSSEPTPMETQATRTFTNPRTVLRENSKAAADWGARRSVLRSCDQCEKSFRYPSHLARHRAVHSRGRSAVPLRKGEDAPANSKEAVGPRSAPTDDQNTSPKMPYLCDQCGAGFCWRSELNQHEYTHFQGGPYYCGICGRQFKRRVQLIKHQIWHQCNQEGEEGGEAVQNMYLDTGSGEYMPRELLQRLPPERPGELCEPPAGPETCECGACEPGAQEASELLPPNSIWEIGVSGQPYLMRLPPTCECGYCDTDWEDGSGARPGEPSLLQADIASGPTPSSPASSCEIFAPGPTIPAASPGARARTASVQKKKTSKASIAVARPPKSRSPDPEWFPSPKRPRRVQRHAGSSAPRAVAHSCPICSKRFRLPGYLKKHLNVHRADKPYSCVLCRKRFGRRTYLFKHCRKMHGEAGLRLP